MTATDTPDFLGSIVNTPDARLVGSAVGQAPNTANLLTLQPTDRSLLVLVLGPGAISVEHLTGGVSGFDWATLGTNGFGPFNTLVDTIPVWGIIDPTVTLQIDASGPITWWAVAMPDEYLQGSPVNPLQVRQVDYAPYETHAFFTASVTGGDATILAAPVGGTVWEVVSVGLSLNAGSGAGSECQIRGLASSTPMMQLNGGAGEPSLQWGGAPMYLTEGLKLHNTAAVAANGYVVARSLSVFIQPG